MDWFAIFELVFDGLYQFGKWLTVDLGRAALIMVGVIGVYIALRLVFKLLKALFIFIVILIVCLVAWIYFAPYLDLPAPDEMKERIDI